MILKTRFAILVFYFVVSVGWAEEVLKVTARDSYLDAYKESRNELLKGFDKVITQKPSEVNKTDRDFNVDPFYPGPSSSGDSFGAPQPPYGPPQQQYGPPQQQYGPPSAPQYGPPPQPQYGPPIGSIRPEPPKYGPPHPPTPIYGPPSHQSVQVYYGGMPHAMLSLWDKIKLKLDIFTIGKILLKLVIFKKIVSLIAILCLLLFIPSLKHKFSGAVGSAEDDSLMRSLNPRKTGEENINHVTAFIMESIENFGKNNETLNSPCRTTYCLTKKALGKVEKKYSYKKLAKMYLHE